jgi:hypothetical protein
MLALSLAGDEPQAKSEQLKTKREQSARRNVSPAIGALQTLGKFNYRVDAMFRGRC